MAIRKRAKPDKLALPPFSSASVCKENARFDKIEIVFPTAAIATDGFEDAINQVKQGDLFTGGGAGNKLSFSKAVKSNRTQQWLVEGINRPVIFHSGNSARVFSLSCRLNFNRFWEINAPRFTDLSPNAFARRANPLLREEDHSPRELYAASKAHVKATRNTLDNKGNVLLGANWERTTHASHCLQYQVNKLVELFEQELSPFQRLDLHAEDWFIPRAEVCFDFYHEDAVGHINRLLPALQAIQQSGRHKKYPIEQFQERNSIGFRLQLTKSATVIIYAKQEKRIRCEVSYSKSLRTIFKRELCRLDPSEKALALVGEIADVAIKDATNRVQRLLAELEGVVQPTSINIPVTLASLMHELSIATKQNKAISTYILSQLINKRNITEGSRTKSAIRTLVERGVLKKVQLNKRSATPHYRAQGQYQLLFEILDGASK